MTEDISVRYFEYSHEVLDESSDRSALLICESWADNFYPESMVVESYHFSPIRFSSVPGDLFWICELVSITVRIYEEVSGYWVICFIFGSVFIATCKYFEVPFERSWWSGCMVNDDVLTSVFYSLSKVSLS